MTRTNFSGYIVSSKIFRYRRTASCPCQFSCNCTDCFLFNRSWHLEVPCLQTGMDTAHDGVPDPQTEGSVNIRQRFWIIISAPYTAGVVRSITAEPEVFVFIGGSGLTCNRHIGKGGSPSCSACNNAFHCACKKSSSGVFDRCMRFGRILDQNISIMIQNFCVKSRCVVYTAVSNRSKSSAQFIIIYTICQTAKSDRFIFIIVHQSAHREILFCVFISQIRCDLLDRFYSTGVLRIGNGFSYCNITHIAVAGILEFRTVGIGPRFIIYHIGKSNLVGIQSRCICREDFKTGTGLSSGTGVSAVQALACLFGASSAHQSFDLTCSLIHQCDRSLRLRSKDDGFVIGISFLCNAGLPSSNDTVRVLFRREGKPLCASVCFSAECLDMTFTVIFHSAISSCDSQGIGRKSHFFQPGVITVIVHLFITDLLKGKILSRDNGKASAVKGIVSLRLCIAQLGLQIVDYLFREGVYKIGIRRILTNL